MFQGLRLRSNLRVGLAQQVGLHLRGLRELRVGAARGPADLGEPERPVAEAGALEDLARVTDLGQRSLQGRAVGVKCKRVEGVAEVAAAKQGVQVGLGVDSPVLLVRRAEDACQDDLGRGIHSADARGAQLDEVAVLGRIRARVPEGPVRGLVPDLPAPDGQRRGARMLRRVFLAPEGPVRAVAADERAEPRGPGGAVGVGADRRRVLVLGDPGGDIQQVGQHLDAGSRGAADDPVVVAPFA